MTLFLFYSFFLLHFTDNSLDFSPLFILTLHSPPHSRASFFYFFPSSFFLLFSLHSLSLHSLSLHSLSLHSLFTSFSILSSLSLLYHTSLPSYFYIHIYLLPLLTPSLSSPFYVSRNILPSSPFYYIFLPSFSLPYIFSLLNIRLFSIFFFFTYNII